MREEAAGKQWPSQRSSSLAQPISLHVYTDDVLAIGFWMNMFSNMYRISERVFPLELPLYSKSTSDVHRTNLSCTVLFSAFQYDAILEKMLTNVCGVVFRSTCETRHYMLLMLGVAEPRGQSEAHETCSALDLCHHAHAVRRVQLKAFL